MPTAQATTKEAEQIWASPDGQRKLRKVIMEVNGASVEVRTYSDQIATVGWSGTVETYEKPGKDGHAAQTFVKQPPKEGGYSGGSASTSGSGKPTYQPRDDDAIKAMFAIKGAVELAKLNPKSTIIDVEATARQLYDMVERVKTPLDDGITIEEINASIADTSVPTQDRDPEPVSEEDMKKINDIFTKPEDKEKE